MKSRKLNSVLMQQKSTEANSTHRPATSSAVMRSEGGKISKSDNFDVSWLRCV